MLTDESDESDDESWVDDEEGAIWQLRAGEWEEDLADCNETETELCMDRMNPMLLLNGCTFKHKHWKFGKRNGDLYWDAPIRKSGHKWFPLHDAATCNDTKRIGTWLARQCAIDERCYRGATALHYACAFNAPDAVTTLLKQGADPFARWEDTFRPKHTSALLPECALLPVHVAVHHGSIDALRALWRFVRDKEERSLRCFLMADRRPHRTVGDPPSNACVRHVHGPPLNARVRHLLGAMLTGGGERRLLEEKGGPMEHTILDMVNALKMNDTRMSKSMQDVRALVLAAKQRVHTFTLLFTGLRV